MTIEEWRRGAQTAALIGLTIATVSAQEAVNPTPSKEAEAPRTWTDTTGQQHSGKLLAYDNVRATLQLSDGRVVFVSPQSLSGDDQQHLLQWRKDHPDGSWVALDHIPPWPHHAGNGPVRVVAISADAANSHYTYHSANFAIRSDVSLTLNTIADIANSFESTREAILSLPLGLAAKPALPLKYRNATMFYYGSDGKVYRRSFPDEDGTESQDAAITPTRKRLPVELYITPQAYGLAGGLSGTGGYYSTFRGKMLISLQNFGIKIDENGRVSLDYRDNLFILRHEVSHQIMRDWLPHIPIWLNEGIAEYMAAIPYKAGRYQFLNLEKPFLAYLNKWRFEEDPRTIPMRHPAEVLKMTSEEWESALKMNASILNYNSAALLTWYFLHDDGERNARDLAAYFDAVRHKPEDTEALIAVHLLRGRTPEKIASEIRAAWKRFGVEIVFQ